MKINLKISVIAILICVILCRCKGNSDADYISGFKDLKRFAKHYADSVNKESYRIDSLRILKNK